MSDPAANAGATLASLGTTYTPPADSWDELCDETGSLRPSWQRFVEAVGGLDAASLGRAAERVSRQVHENGLIYSAWTTSDSANRPWPLDVFPTLVEGATWQRVARGLSQYARLFDAIARDIYGPQHLIAAREVPAELVFAHPGFLRPCHGVAPIDRTHIHVLACDLTHGPDGIWHLSGIRADVPYGLGYILETRSAMIRVWPDAARALSVQALAPFVDDVRDVLAGVPGLDEPPHVVLLSPGPLAATYFEHIYMARELGLPLVQGADLVVRHARVFLKTVAGLRPVHGIWRLQADRDCDPLAFGAEATLGIAGLVDAWRAGHVLIANALGLGVLEQPALLAGLPAACERLLGEPLNDDVPVLTEHGPLSHGPVWAHGSIESRPITVRTFLVSDRRGGYRLLPGGLSRVAADAAPASVWRSNAPRKDTWVLAASPAGAAMSVDADAHRRDDPARERMTSSRAAEHLFWLGRYAERSENQARLMRAVLGRLPEAPSLALAFRACLLHACQDQGLIPTDEVPGRPSDITDGVLASIERVLLDGLSNRGTHTSLAFNVGETWRVAATVRERLSSDNWRVLTRLYQRVLGRAHDPVQPGEAFEFLDDVIVQLVAVAGLETAHMTRDDGWRFLSLGRYTERLSFIGSAIGSITMHRAMHEPTVLEWLLDLSDSLMTYRARHVRPPEWASVVDLLLFDERNPRAGMFQVAKMEKIVPQLPGPDPLDVLREIEELHGAARVTAENRASLFGGSISALDYLPRACARLGARVSDAVTLRYFTHAEERPQVT